MAALGFLSPLRLLPNRFSKKGTATEVATHTLAPGDQRILLTSRITIALVTLGLLALVGRVIQLQTVPEPQIAELVNSQHSTLALSARRGTILDRKGRVLSTSDTLQRLYIDPQSISDTEKFSGRVSQHLGYDAARIEQLIGRNIDRRFVVLDPNLSLDRQDSLAKFRIDGLGVETRLVRNYPLGQLAGQLLGFVNFEGQGIEGTEKLVNPLVAETPGQMVYLRDAKRKPIWIDGTRYQPPRDGDSVRLSIDATIQTIAETQLQNACREFDAQSGQIVVMDPYTGEILAIANYPSFDPNNLASSSADLRRNRAITDIFEPGSIFKPVVWSAATQMGLARPNEVIDCTTGLWVTSAGRRLHDAHGNGLQTWDGVLIKSSNIGMAKVGERMGALKMYRAVTAFGFGSSTECGLDGESSGMVNQLKRWNPYSISSVPMGQEVGVTTLQMARAYCVFANGGFLIRPRLLAVDQPSQLGGKHVIGRVLRPEIAVHTREVLRKVVTEGTGKKAESKIYTVFGKTGTAQIAQTGRGGYIPGAYIGSFIGGAPLNQPRLVVACSIHRPDPRKGHFGGIIAAPAAKNVLEQSLLYMGVTPDQPPPQADSHIQTVAADARE